MSKKLYSTERWKHYLRMRQKAQEGNAKRKRKRAKGHQKALKVTPAARRKFHLVVAPAVLSMVRNPVATINFLNSLRFYARKYNLTLDLAGVSHITTDAIAVLVAALSSLPVNVQGNLPEDASAQRMLVGSGFFDHYTSMQPLPKVSHGQISQEKSKKVQPDLARDLIHFGIRSLRGTEGKCTAAYRVLIESMLNTHNHAAKPKANHETWWATVYADAARKRVCFTFVDTGVGIFKSVRVGKLRTLYRFLGGYTDAEMLRDMLHGKVESSTGISYRGKGLPAIHRLSGLGKIDSLIIVANEVYANVSAGEYRMLNVAFRGTLLYWEIEVAWS